MAKSGVLPVEVTGSKAQDYERIASLGTAAGLDATKAAAASWARIFVEDGSASAGTGEIRFRDDGTTVTTSTGAPYGSGSYFETYDPAHVSIIASVTGSAVTVEYH